MVVGTTEWKKTMVPFIASTNGRRPLVNLTASTEWWLRVEFEGSRWKSVSERSAPRFLRNAPRPPRARNTCIVSISDKSLRSVRVTKSGKENPSNGQEMNRISKLRLQIRRRPRSANEILGMLWILRRIYASNHIFWYFFFFKSDITELKVNED